LFKPILSAGVRWLTASDYVRIIRYAGLFSNRWKKQYLAQARTASSLSESDDCSENTKPLWAERQTDYTGINPLQ
jgi:hypothetical protein